MKVVILAGGYGTRLSEYTDIIPKPMVEIGGKPILLHIMNWYSSFGHKDFYIALGYKSETIKKYFINYKILNSDIKIDLSLNKINYINEIKNDWKITLVDTGVNSMTGGRLLRMKNILGSKEPFLLTYGDGVSDIDINRLLRFHKKNKKMVTVTAVRPSARFGELSISKNEEVIKFKEKPQADQGWINGGFFVMEPKFLDLIKNDETVLEQEPLEKVSKLNELMAYKHTGFWQCMDTKRDKDYLEEVFLNGLKPFNK